MKEAITSVLDLLAVIFVVGGAFMISTGVGFMALGVALGLISIVIDRMKLPDIKVTEE